MGWVRVAEAEVMPSLAGGNAEAGCAKLKKGNRFLKPNFGLGPNRAGLGDGFAGCGGLFGRSSVIAGNQPPSQ
jgi:hypothetical protein